MIQPAIPGSPRSRMMKAMTEPAATTMKTWSIIAKQVTKTTTQDLQCRSTCSSSRWASVRMMGFGKASSRAFSWCWISDSCFSPAGAGVTASDFEISMADKSHRKMGEVGRRQSQRRRSHGIMILRATTARQTRPTAVALTMIHGGRGSVTHELWQRVALIRPGLRALGFRPVRWHMRGSPQRRIGERLGRWPKSRTEGAGWQSGRSCSREYFISLVSVWWKSVGSL